VISGSTLEGVLQSEVSNNSINSYPLVFKQNITGGTLQANGTYLILVNCHAVEISGQFLLDPQFAFCSNLSLHSNMLRRLQLTYCLDSTIRNNTITMGTSYSPGILLYSSSNNQIKNNTIAENLGVGMRLSFSENNSLANNTILNCSKGIFLEYSNHTMLIGNFIHLEPYSKGIDLERSKNTTLIDNQLFGCYLDFSGGLGLDFLPPPDIDDHFQVEANNNFVDGGSLIFWKDRSNSSVPADANQVFLINCSFIELSHQNLLSVKVFFSSHLDIHDNDFFDGPRWGLYMESTTHSIVTRNTINHVNNEGFHLFRCYNTVVSYNTIINGDGLGYFNGDGLYLVSGGNNTVLENVLVDAGLRIHISHQNNISSNSVTNGGIDVDGANENLLFNNSVMISSDYEYYGEGGIIIIGTGGNRIISNHISNSRGNGIVVGFVGSSFTMISGNKLVNNAGYGVFLDDSSFWTIVRYNDFIGNQGGESQASDDGSSNIFIFNYWEDWLTPDENNDEIVDIAYSIYGPSSNSDNFPRLVPLEDISSHLLAPPKIIFPRPDETYSSPLLISWIGAMDSMGHPINYSIFYSINEGETWISIVSGLAGFPFEYSWNLSSQLEPKAVFLIKVMATCSNGISAFDITHESIIFELENQTSKKSTFLDVFSIVMIFILFTFHKKKGRKEVKK
jgi:parallel beta-helix repeat protein